MKKLTTLLVVILMAIGLSSTAQAVQQYYTFDGTITTISHDNAGAIANAGFSEGSAVTYTLLIDFDAAASETHFGGYVDYDSYADTTSLDHFYVDYFSGDALVQVDGGYYNTVGPADGSGPMNASEKNWGYNTLIGGAGSQLHTNSDDDQLQLKSIGINASDWVIGTTVHVDNWAFDSNNRQSQLFANVQLTDISPVIVPEPISSTLFLVGGATLGFRRFRKKFKK